MEQYIDKSALIAEIERLSEEKGVFYASDVLYELEEFIDTFEVKEVDLDYIKKELDKVVRIYKPNRDFGWGTLYNVATYFYELGLKAQKGE